MQQRKTANSTGVLSLILEADRRESIRPGHYNSSDAEQTEQSS